MSTILNALDRQRSDRERDGDPEAILERNAAYREALRRKRPSSASQRKTLIFSSLSLILALSCMILLVWNWMYGPPSGQTGQAVGAADAEAPAVVASSAPTPKATSDPRRLPVRERVTLRARPLLRDPGSPGANPMGAVWQPPGPAGPVYAAGPQPGFPVVAPSPVVTPQPSVVVSPDGVETPSNEVSSDPASAKARSPSGKTVSRNDPNDFLKLTGIIRDPEKPQALINDHILSPGDTIEGVKVLSIDNGSSVQVEYRGKRHTLVLK